MSGGCGGMQHVLGGRKFSRGISHESGCVRASRPVHILVWRLEGGMGDRGWAFLCGAVWARFHPSEGVRGEGERIPHCWEGVGCVIWGLRKS